MEMNEKTMEFTIKSLIVEVARVELASRYGFNKPHSQA